MLIIPEFSTNYSYPKQCRQYKLAMYNKGIQVGEALVAIANYADLLNASQTLDTIAKYHTEDMHLAFSALNKHPIFNQITSNPVFQGRSPIVAYLARIYIFPEHRNQRLSYDFLSQLPSMIQEISFTYPLAIAVYISPQSYLPGPDGNNQIIPAADVRKMKKQMKHMFKQAGYERTSLSPLHKDCLCWFDPTLR